MLPISNNWRLTPNMMPPDCLLGDMECQKKSIYTTTKAIKFDLRASTYNTRINIFSTEHFYTSRTNVWHLEIRREFAIHSLIASPNTSRCLFGWPSHWRRLKCYPYLVIDSIAQYVILLSSEGCAFVLYPLLLDVNSNVNITVMHDIDICSKRICNL
jgi:hypothetical protein